MRPGLPQPPTPCNSEVKAGDLELVLWAVNRGLGIDPVREELYRHWMHALGRGPDAVMVTGVFDRLRTALQDHIDPTQQPSPESQEVYRYYLPARISVAPTR